MPLAGAEERNIMGWQQALGARGQHAQFASHGCRAQASCLLPQLSAARKRTTQQLYIKGLTPRPNASFAPKAHERQSWLAVTIIQLSRPTVVIPVQTPKDKYSYTTWARKEKEGGRAELTGPMYRRVMKQQLRPNSNLADAAKRPPKRTINLLHDRDPAHTSKTFLRFADDYNINAKLLPPNSPDLDPLDYGVFGPAQKKLDRELELRDMSFEEQCQFLTEAIKQANSDAAIMQLPLRIKRCIETKGWHFE